MDFIFIIKLLSIIVYLIVNKVKINVNYLYKVNDKIILLTLLIYILLFSSKKNNIVQGKFILLIQHSMEHFSI